MELRRLFIFRGVEWIWLRCFGRRVASKAGKLSGNQCRYQVLQVSPGGVTAPTHDSPETAARRSRPRIPTWMDVIARRAWGPAIIEATVRRDLLCKRALPAAGPGKLAEVVLPARLAPRQRDSCKAPANIRAAWCTAPPFPAASPKMGYSSQRHILSPGKLLVKTDRKSTRLNSSHLGISYAVF